MCRKRNSTPRRRAASISATPTIGLVSTLIVRSLLALSPHAAQAGIEAVTQPVTDSVERQYQDEDAEAGPEDVPGSLRRVALRGLEHRPPRRGGGLDAQTQVA